MARTFQGDVSFILHDQPSPHRFEVSVTEENKITIWLENRQTKKQWHTDPLATSDFVREDNAIPKATISDYAERFAACLGATADEAVKYGRSLSSKGADRTLVLTLPLQWAAHDLSVEYKFAMKEVPLERIDILGARMRDVEDKLVGVDESRLGRLEQENIALKEETKRLEKLVAGYKRDADRGPVYVQGTTIANHATNQKLVWVGKECVSGGAIEIEKGRIHFHTAGIYAIDVGVVHAGAQNGLILELMKRDATLVTCQGSSYNGYYTTTTLRYILKAEASDELHVVYKGTGNAYPGSYITVVKL